MQTKLTLKIDESVLKKAKGYSKKKGRSLSDMVENYLKAVSGKVEDTSEQKMSPIVKSLKGTFKSPKGFNYKKELSKALEQKYLQHEKNPD